MLKQARTEFAKENQCQSSEAWNARARRDSPVQVFTEWDPLEEVIVGVIDHARVPEWDPGLSAVIPASSASFFREGFTHFPEHQLRNAKSEVDNFATLLESEGVIVRRPGQGEFHRSVRTPTFDCGGGLYAAMPRDCLFAIGDLIVEAPMAWRSRYFETFSFRSILNDYFERGARWIAAPKPMLGESMWNIDHDRGVFDSVIKNDEPLFDAADFVRIGCDIIGQRSHVTNRKGIDWLRMAIGDQFKIHVYQFDDASPMHIDTTILPLAPGKVLVNPVWVNRLPDIFKDWEVLTPPPSTLSDSHPLYMTSKWIHSNVLMLDEKRVVVEQEETALIAAFKKWGFTPILCPFRNFQTFGGSFHCATLDIRRRGQLKSYF
jgi:glycine amidinotransferase